MHHHSNSFFPSKPQYLLWAVGTVSLPNSQNSLDMTDNDSCHDVYRWERYPLTSFGFLSQKEPERIIETSSGAPEAPELDLDSPSPGRRHKPAGNTAFSATMAGVNRRAGAPLPGSS